jgi:hypothetical protein
LNSGFHPCLHLFYHFSHSASFRPYFLNLIFLSTSYVCVNVLN